MSTLVAFLPPRHPNQMPGDWALGAVPFVLYDRHGQRQRAGQAAPALLPKANRVVGVVAARDVVLLSAVVPPLKGPRLRQALPNIIEELIVQDPARCHVALGAAAAGTASAAAPRTLAVIDRAWMRFLLEALKPNEDAAVALVPLLSCLPPAAPGDAVVTVLGAANEDEAGAASVELALQDETSRVGLSAPVAVVASTASGFARGRPLVLREAQSGSMHIAVPAGLLVEATRTEQLDYEHLAQAALELPLDLCQFEFAADADAGTRTLRRWRAPLGWAAATILVALVGLNLDWLMLAHERDRLDARASALLMEAFPRTTTIVDAPLQMSRQLEALRAAAGAPTPSDFVVLCDRLARSLGPLPPTAIATLDYADRVLSLTFTPGTTPDPGFTQRLAANNLAAEESGGKWQIRSRT